LKKITLKPTAVKLTVRRGKECEYVRDKVPLVVLQLVIPVVEILGEVDLLGGPKRSLRLLVHLPNVRVLKKEGGNWVKVEITPDDVKLFISGKALLTN
jgi:hypothetical protein